MRGAVRLAAAVLAVLVVPACSSLQSSDPSADAEPGAGDAGTLQVAAYNFGESQIVANVYSGALNAAGESAEVKTLTNREIVIPAAEQGEIQVVPEYAGTLTEFLNKQVNGPDAPAQASPNIDVTVKHLRKLADQVGLVVLEPAPARNQNAFAVRKEFAAEHNLTTLTQLGEYSQQSPVSVGGPPECPARPFCLIGLEDTYGVQVSEFVSLDAGGPLTKSALEQGMVDVGLVLTSDGALDQFGLVILTDDKNLQASDNIIPVVNAKADNDTINKTLNAVSAKLTQEALRQMNYAVDWERQDPATVAQSWLVANGLA
ncbi:MAG: ABC transporter substrate-binding protein [Candidatus Nanopelagicales bacterium]